MTMIPLTHRRRVPASRALPARGLPPGALLLGVLLLGAFALARPAASQLICTEPLVPLCATQPGMIADEQQLSLCLGDLDRYETQLGDYVTCIRETADAAEGRRAATASFRACLESGAAAESCEALAN